jgi:hypothetical protein
MFVAFVHRWRGIREITREITFSMDLSWTLTQQGRK